MASTTIYSDRAGFQALSISSSATPVDGINQSENVEGAYRLGTSPTMSHARDFEISAIPVKER